jgi:RecJ-like exonuclease
MKIGREVKRVQKEFEWGLKNTWWGYLLDEIPCDACSTSGKTSKGEYCPVCCGEGKVSPRVEVPEGDYL